MIPQTHHIEAALFAEELEQVGVEIDNRSSAIERICEASNWKAALACLLKNGSKIQIQFHCAPTAFAAVSAVLTKYGFSAGQTQEYAAFMCQMQNLV